MKFFKSLIVASLLIIPATAFAADKAAKPLTQKMMAKAAHLTIKISNKITLKFSDAEAKKIMDMGFAEANQYLRTLAEMKLGNAAGKAMAGDLLLSNEEFETLKTMGTLDAISYGTTRSNKGT